MSQDAGDSGVDRLLRARIAGQSGLVSRGQALAAGYTPAKIRWQLESGRWVQRHRGVYLTTPGRDDWDVRAVAALLAVGVPSALCGESAGAVWGLAKESSGPINVLVPVGRHGVDRPGIAIVRTRRFTERVHPTVWPPRTTADHTVFDLALGHGLDRVVALMGKACQLRICTEQTLAAALQSRPNQPLRGVIAEPLGLVGAGAESAAEVRYVRDVELAHGLPTGERQSPAPGQRFRDSEYPALQVIVEIDGRLGHSGWAGRQRDSRRDRKAATGGRLTVRAGWLEVAVEPCEFADDLAQIFAIRGWTGVARTCGPGCGLVAAA
jgi:hypothetical protein